MENKSIQLNEDIRTIDAVHGFDDETSSVGQAWSRIKKTLGENKVIIKEERYTKCPKCGSERLCYWLSHDSYGCYYCTWVEAL
jgi:hypothetical protein